MKKMSAASWYLFILSFMKEVGGGRALGVTAGESDIFNFKVQGFNNPYETLKNKNKIQAMCWRVFSC